MQNKNAQTGFVAKVIIKTQLQAKKSIFFPCLLNESRIIIVDVTAAGAWRHLWHEAALRLLRYSTLRKYTKKKYLPCYCCITLCF